MLFSGECNNKNEDILLFVERKENLYEDISSRWQKYVIYGPGYPSRYSDSLQAGRTGDRITVGSRLSALSRPALGPTQNPIKWVPFFPWTKEAGTWR